MIPDIIKIEVSLTGRTRLLATLLKFGTLMAIIPIDANIILLLPKPPEEPGRITLFHPTRLFQHPGSVSVLSSQQRART
jgi:hypothetical protein